MTSRYQIFRKEHEDAMMWSWNVKFTLNGIFNLDDDNLLTSLTSLTSFSDAARAATPRWQFSKIHFGQSFCRTYFHAIRTTINIENQFRTLQWPQYPKLRTFKWHTYSGQFSGHRRKTLLHKVKEIVPENSPPTWYG